jgi:hypothetical protein
MMTVMDARSGATTVVVSLAHLVHQDLQARPVHQDHLDPRVLLDTPAKMEKTVKTARTVKMEKTDVTVGMDGTDVMVRKVKRARWVRPAPVVIPVKLATKAAKAKLDRRVLKVLKDLPALKDLQERTARMAKTAKTAETAVDKELHCVR